jgi:hypothetical protein
MAEYWSVYLDEVDEDDHEIIKLNIWKRTYAQFLSIEFLLISVTTDRLHSACSTSAARYVRNAISGNGDLFVVFVSGEHMENYRWGRWNSMCSGHPLMLLKIKCHSLMPTKIIKLYSFFSLILIFIIM